MGRLEFARNVYPDPSHEYGLAPLPSTPDTGNGVITLDQALFRSGKQSVKITNNDPSTIMATNMINDPDGYQNNQAHWNIQGATGTPTTETGSGWFGVSWAATGPGSTAGVAYGYTAQASAPELACSPGETRSPSVQVWSNVAQNMRLVMMYHGDGSTTALAQPPQVTVAVPANTWTTILMNNTSTPAPAGTTRVSLRALVTVAPAAGTEVRARYLTLVNGTTAIQPFSGNTPATSTARCRWTGEANNSPSIKVGGAPKDCCATAYLGTCSDLGLHGGSTITCGVRAYIPSSVTGSKIISIGGTGVQKVDVPIAGLARGTWAQAVARTTIMNADGTIDLTVYAGGLAGDTISFDDFSVADGDQVRDFNGDTPAAGSISYGWVDTPGRSASIQYMIVPVPAPQPSVWQPTLNVWRGVDGSEWDLTDPDSGVFMTRGGVIGLGGTQYDSYDTDAAGRPGHRHRGSRVQPRTVEWPIYLFSDESSAAWRKRAQAWRRSFHRDKIGTWVVTLDGGERRYLDLRIAPDFADAGYDLDPLMYGWQQYTMELIADNPFWRGDPITGGWRGDTAATDPFFDPAGSPPFHIVGTNTTASATITNPGDEDAWPTFRLVSVSDVVITIGDGQISPNDAGSGGNALTIITDPANASVISANGTNYFSRSRVWNPRPIPAHSTVPIGVSMSKTGYINYSITPLYEAVY